jgi:hypothetical protein
VKKHRFATIRFGYYPKKCDSHTSTSFNILFLSSLTVTNTKTPENMKKDEGANSVKQRSGEMLKTVRFHAYSAFFLQFDSGRLSVSFLS